MDGAGVDCLILVPLVHGTQFVSCVCDVIGPKMKLFVFISV